MALAKTMEPLLQGNSVIRKMFELGQEMALQYGRAARHLTQRFELPYEKEQILLCAGAAGGLNVLMRCLLDEEDEVLCFAPYFTEYNAYVSHYKGKLTVVPIKEDNFSLDIAMADRLIRRKTKAVILNTPNNPSGVVYKEEE